MDELIKKSNLKIVVEALMLLIDKNSQSMAEQDTKIEELRDKIGSPVQYVEQELTDAQKVQVRKNLDLYWKHTTEYTWDGVTDGLEVVGDEREGYYRISGDVIPRDVLDGYTVEAISAENGTQTTVCTSGDLWGNDEVYGPVTFFVVTRDGARLSDVTFPLKGIYFYRAADEGVEGYVSKLYKEEKETIPEWALPHTLVTKTEMQEADALLQPKLIAGNGIIIEEDNTISVCEDVYADQLIVASYEEAVEYATTNPLAYIGQTITVVDHVNDTVAVYIIANSSMELSQIGGTSSVNDYNQMFNKPQINGVTLAGNKTAEDLDIDTNSMTNTDIEAILIL